MLSLNEHHVDLSPFQPSPTPLPHSAVSLAVDINDVAGHPFF